MTLAPPRTRGSSPLAARLPEALAAAAVGCQMAFPFTAGGTPTLVVLTVVLFAAAALASAWQQRGARGSLILLGVAGGGGLLAETLGVHTSVPFGEYAYSDFLGPALLGVPVVVPMAWVMMSYPALLVGRRLTSRRWPAVAVGAWALASWDVFLDPQMVDAGAWRWAHPAPSLPGVAGVPLTNFAGWLAVALLLVAALDAALPAADRGLSRALAWTQAEDRVPGALYLWTYASSVLAHAFFFGRPPVALVGAVLMGLVAVPYGLVRSRAGRRAP